MAGNLIILSAPSGAGKTTLVKEIRQRFQGVGASVSYTSRPARPGEVNGRDYHFVTPEKFRAMVENGDFLEWAEVHSNLYGTSHQVVRQLLAEGLDVILTIDVQGAAQARQIFPWALSVFLLPPSLAVLIERLYNRGSAQPDDLRLRLANARRELLQYKEYDFLIVNQELESAIREFEAILIAARCRQVNRTEAVERLLQEFDAA